MNPDGISYLDIGDAYWRRDFDAGLALLDSQPSDPPSRVLAERCRLYRSQPPPPDWDGIHVATAK